MGILLPNQDMGWLRADAPVLDKQLREGDGIHWSGDPRLFLSQGVLEEMRGGRPTGNIRARRWEVWRHCEDGTDQIIGHWQMHEFDQILFDLARMRLDAPGHEDTIDRIDAANEANEKKIWQGYRENYGEMTEHLTKLWHDRNNPKNVFRGMPGRNPEKQS